MADVPFLQKWRQGLWLRRDDQLRRGEYLVTDAGGVILAGGNVLTGTKFTTRHAPHLEATTVRAPEDVIDVLMKDVGYAEQEVSH